MSSNKNKKVFSPYTLIVSKIEEVTKIKRINMRELGSELGVTVSAVSDFSKKGYIPSGTMMRWCQARGVSVDWVLGKEPNKDNNQPSSEETMDLKELLQAKDIMIRDKDEIIALLKDKLSLMEGSKLQKKG